MNFVLLIPIPVTKAFLIFSLTLQLDYGNPNNHLALQIAFVAQAGVGNYERAKKALKVGSLMIAVVSLCLTGVVLLVGKYLISIFGLTPESVEIGKSFFYSIAVCYVVYGLAMALRGFLEGIGDMLFSALTGIASLGVRIAASYAFVDIFGRMIIGYAEAFSWVFLLVVYFIRYVVKRKKLRATAINTPTAKPSDDILAVD